MIKCCGPSEKVPSLVKMVVAEGLAALAEECAEVVASEEAAVEALDEAVTEAREDDDDESFCGVSKVPPQPAKPIHRETLNNGNTASGFCVVCEAISRVTCRG